jgi:hypothetical protein
VDVYQCPDCELRFRFPSELEAHMAADHPDFHVTPKTIEDALIPTARKHGHRRGYKPVSDTNAG